jgi:predicted CopG family antitoxin
MAETTTIQVDRETLQVLEYLKRAQGAKSYAEVLRMLIRDSKRLPQSERGAFPKLRPFKRDKRDRLD